MDTSMELQIHINILRQKDYERKILVFLSFFYI